MMLRRRQAVRLLSFAAIAAAVPARAADLPRVYAVNAPLADFASRIAGDAATVVFPVPEGTDPAFWRPSIAEVAEIQAADLILLNGASYAQWTEKTSLPRSRIVDTSRAFTDDLIAAEGVVHSHGDDGEHSHTGTASITWLDYAQAAMQAQTIADALAKRLPEHADAFAANLDALKGDLAALDAEAQRVGASASGIGMIASHPLYQYFARAYDLEVQSLDLDPSETPTEEQWTELDELKNDDGPTIMLWEAEPLPETRERLEGSGIAVVVFPTLANDRGDFVAQSRESLARLQAAVAAVL